MEQPQTEWSWEVEKLGRISQVHLDQYLAQKCAWQSLTLYFLIPEVMILFQVTTVGAEWINVLGGTHTWLHHSISVRSLAKASKTQLQGSIQAKDLCQRGPKQSRTLNKPIWHILPSTSATFLWVEFHSTTVFKWSETNYSLYFLRVLSVLRHLLQSKYSAYHKNYIKSA